MTTFRTTGPFTTTPSRSTRTTPPTRKRTSQASPSGALSSETKYVPFAAVVVAQRIGGPIVTHTPPYPAPPELVTRPLMPRPPGFGGGGGAVGRGAGARVGGGGAWVGSTVGSGVGSTVGS